MSGKRLLQRLMSMLGLALAAGLAMTAPAHAQPCDPEEASWVPSQYYTKDMVVHHNDQWYQARAFSEGKEPGITFEWRELDQAPDCGPQGSEGAQIAPPEATAGKTGKQTQPDSATEDPSANSGSTLCVRPEHWRFTHSYDLGALVTHGGKVWKAVTKTSGDMPSTAEPPRWQLVPDHCSMKLD